MAILVTGATGHLGPHLIDALLKRGDFDRLYVAARRNDAVAPAPRVMPIEADFANGRAAFSDGDARRIQRDVRVIIHAAADTRLTVPIDQLRPANAGSTDAVCRLAGGCRDLQQLLFVSTACVAGRRTGRIPEQIADASAGFANAYEESKWQAEQIVAASGLPARIARLSTCAGGHVTGQVHRFGALHHLLHWMSRGLVPMVPGSAETPVDVISTDVAASWLARAASDRPRGLEICHVARGEDAIPLGQLLAFLPPVLNRAAARTTRAIQPLLVDGAVFQSFNRMVGLSGDALLTRVQASAAALLPSLLHPKVYETTSAERCWGGPLPHPDWQSHLERVIAFAQANRWGFAAERADRGVCLA
jgi:nucleoside-diphosphate-sugar epimerase